MDRVTQAVTSNDLEALKALYAPDATAETADQGTITGRDAVVAYLGGFVTAFPDASFESVHQHETGDTASTRATSSARVPALWRRRPARAFPRPGSGCACASVTSRR